MGTLEQTQITVTEAVVQRSRQVPSREIYQYLLPHEPTEMTHTTEYKELTHYYVQEYRFSSNVQ